MACEQIAVAGIQISQVMGSREANIVNGIQVGLAICHDIRFPELARKLTLERDFSIKSKPKHKGV